MDIYQEAVETCFFFSKINFHWSCFSSPFKEVGSRENTSTNRNWLTLQSRSWEDHFSQKTIETWRFSKFASPFGRCLLKMTWLKLFIKHLCFKSKFRVFGWKQTLTELIERKSDMKSFTNIFTVWDSLQFWWWSPKKQRILLKPLLPLGYRLAND